MDKSLNQREASSVGTPYLNTMSGPNNGRAIEIRSGDYLPIDGTFFAKDYFFVFRSPPDNSVWSGYGGPMGHNPSSGHTQRNSNYITQHNATYFHSNQYPAEVFKNGVALSGNFDLETITDYMIVRLVVNDNDPGPYSSYQIGRLTGLQCNLDIAEILAFGNKLSDVDANLLESYLGNKWVLTNQLPADLLTTSSIPLNTLAERNLSLGTSSSEEFGFEGTMDEIRIYNRSLTASEISILYLGGSVEFTTSNERQPPVVELYQASPESNNSVLLSGELTNIDLENPLVTIYYGSSDGGLAISGWENNLTLNNGNPLSAGEFDANISGLIPGQKYFFRAYAQSADGSDWSTGEPEIKENLLAFWRLDESSGNIATDSVIPLRDALIQGKDENATRTAGYSGNGLTLDGANDWLNLDPENTGYLNESFEGRTFMTWMQIDPKLYAGPEITAFKDLAAYFPFKLGFGLTAFDTNYEQYEASINGKTTWAAGIFDSALNLESDLDHVLVPAKESLSTLHHDSYSISLWVNATIGDDKFTRGQLNAFSFDLEPSDYYLSEIENLLTLQPTFTSLLKDEETIDLNTFSPQDIPGLVIWMDASNENSFDFNETNNAVLDWNNSVIGQGYNFTRSWGDPTRKFSGGKWTVNFDGTDMLGTDSSFNSKNYTVFSISRQTGNDNQRLISSHHNWLFGYHNGGNNRFYFNGWLYSGPDASDTNWHLHTATMNSNDQGSTWKNLVPGVINGEGASNSSSHPGRIRFGGWRNELGTNSETSKGEVSAFLLFNSELSNTERLNIEYYLANKWNMLDQLEFDFNRKLKFTEGADFYELQLTEQNNYNNSLTLFTGVFQAKESGAYQWELANISEQSALWLDKNQNGYFETDERLLVYLGENQSNQVIDSIELAEGNYSLAVYHAVTSEVPSIELRFSTPSSNSGPPSLTTIHPSASDQYNLFGTQSRSTLARRGPIQFGLNKDGTIFFQYKNMDNVVLVESDQKVTQSAWSQVGVSVNEQNSSIELFINGQSVLTSELPSGMVADLSDYLYWNVGGSDPIEQDYFLGKIDELRFYNTALSQEQMLKIYEDDITDQPIIGYRQQVIYDEGDSNNGLLVVNDEGTIRAQVIVNGTRTEVNSTALLQNTNESLKLPFSPLQEPEWNLKLWLDSADIESMDKGSSPGAEGPPASGQTVGFWRDKSQSGHNAKILSGSPKWLNNGFNDNSCIDITNDSFFLENSVSTFEGWDDIVIFATLYQTAFDHFCYPIGKGTQTGWMNSNSYDFSWALTIHRADKNGHRIWGPAINTASGGNSYLRTSSDAIWTHDGFSGGPSLITIRYSSANLSSMSHNLFMKVNGSQSLQSNLTGALKSTSNIPVTIGGTGDGAGLWTGRISEVLIFNNDLGSENIEKIEGYLAHKWNLTNKLPQNHSYLEASPPGYSGLKKVNQIEKNWHHLAVSYGETTKALKLYLDGKLVDQPEISSGDGFVPIHQDVPSIGLPSGSFGLDNFGAFLGSVDDVRVYDRGLSANEISQVFVGDANQTGLVEYRVVEKPQINTLPAMEARPQSVILRANLASIGGEIIEEEISLGDTFKYDTIPGIQAWFDAEQISGQNGQTLSKWQDQSARPNQDRSFNNVSGSPRLLSFALNGNPAVSFDGEDDQMWTGYNFNSILHETGYTILTLARFTGGNNKQVITSRNNDFYFGFHQDGIGLWRAGGNIYAFGDPIDNEWHLHVGTISDNSGDPRASFWQDSILKVLESRESDNQNFGPGQLQLGGKGIENSACEVAEILIFSGELNPLQRATLEGYLAHKWSLQQDILSDDHPYAQLDPFGIQLAQANSRSEGGDPSEVIIFWGDERIESNSTSANPDDNSSWDYKLVLSQAADIGNFEKTISTNLEENKLYYFRAYAKNIAGETWAQQIMTFKTIDTQFTKHSMDGLIFWLDATDIDADGQRDSLLDQANIPIWVDKSINAKDAIQTIVNQMPTYEENGFGSLPSVKFSSGQSMKVGILSNLSGPLNIFASAYGDGVVIGGDDGQNPWTLEASSYNWLNVFRGENESLQQITLGLDPRTNLGMLTGSIGEILVFDRLLEPFEREMVEGYLAHKWGLLDDLAESGFAVSQGLTLYYPFNETGGSIVEDYSDTLRHGMVIDADLNTEGKFTSGIGFDTIDPQNAKIDLDYNSLFFSQPNWTVSTWFKYPIHNPLGDEYVLTWSSGSNFPAFLAGNEQFILSGVSDSDFYATSLSGTEEQPKWHHFALKSDQNSYSLFIDGEEKFKETTYNGGALDIRTIGNVLQGGSRFSPSLDDFRVYERTLTNQEIETIYGSGEGDFGTHRYESFPPIFDNVPVILLPKDAIAHWKFDSLDGIEIIDYSGFENHGFVDNNDSGFDLFINNSAAGKKGQAIRFLDDLKIKTNLDESNDKPNLRNSFSLSFWMNTEDSDANVISSGRFNILIEDGYISANAYVGSRWRSTEPTLLPLGTWLHIVLWWDGNKLRLYINNEEAAASVNAKGNLTGDPTIYLGYDSTNFAFNGLIDDFRIYAHALNPKERENAFNFIDSALVATYGEEFSYQVETLKGPTDFNATGLPSGLSIDEKSGLIFGTPLQSGLDFNVTLVASNSSGSDEENMTLFVNPGTQSIIFEELSSVKYGDPPIDLNWTSTSGLPVNIRIVEGEEFAELTSTQMPTTLNILKTGVVKLEGSQPGDGNATYQAAPKVLDEFLIAKKELVVQIHNHFRKPEEQNPELGYDLIGLVGEDNETEFDRNISLTLSVTDGSIPSPTPVGEYPILGSGGLSDKYFFTYVDGTLTVSNKQKQGIIFDQDLNDIPALSPPILLNGSSINLDNNETTGLPLYYEVENEKVAKILVTQREFLKSHWKFDETKYAEAYDQTGRNSGTLLDLVTVGENNAWKDGKFSGALQLNGNSGRVNFGPIRIEDDYTFSVWVKPDSNSTSSDSPEMNILTKTGVPTMNHFRLYKEDGNGSIALAFYTDGNNTPTIYDTNQSVLNDSNWTHLAISHNPETGNLKIYANGEVVIDEAEVKETNNSRPLDFRFSTFFAGDETSSFAGLIDDLRLYNKSLSQNDITKIYNQGGGDYQTIEILGAGTTRITARQNGNIQYEKALPEYNYLNVIKSDQNITFADLIDRSVGDFPFVLSAEASSGLPVQFSLSDLSLASIKDNYVTVRNAGELVVTATQDGDDRFFAAEPVSQSFNIRFGNLFADSIPGLALWLDANDINNDGIEDQPDDFLASGKISLWADRSGNNNSPVEANSSKMPSWIAPNSAQSLQGKTVVSFNNSFNQSLSLQESISEPAILFLVAKQTSISESKLFGGDLISTNSNGFFSLDYNFGNPSITSVQPANSWTICVLGTMANTQNLWINGTLMGSGNSSFYPKPLDAIGQSFTGEIAELLVFSETLNFVNRQRVEGYLAHKWQLESRLPELHPFSTSVPAFGGNQLITWLGTSDFDDGGDGELELPVKSANDPDFTLNAIASSGLPVIFASSDPTILAIADNQAKILRPGKINITAYQPGNIRFFAAQPQSVALEIIDFSDPSFQKDTQAIIFSEVPKKVREDPPFQVVATAESSGQNHSVYKLPVVLKVESGPATIDAHGVVTLDGSAGTIVISAYQSGNAFVDAANTQTLEIIVSNRTRPVILFTDLKNEGSLAPVLANSRTKFIPGVYASNGNRVSLTSSDSSIVEIYGQNKIIAHRTGVVTLNLNVPEDDNFVAALPRTRTLEVVKPTKAAWLENRRNDTRYTRLKERFVNNRLNSHSSVTTEQAEYEFDSDNFDSDGDGYSNLFERATGMDSLGFDSQNAPHFLNPENGKSGISFTRFTNSFSSTGESFQYMIEESFDLRSWRTVSLSSENSKVIPIGGGMERVSYFAEESAHGDTQPFLRLKIGLSGP